MIGKALAFSRDRLNEGLSPPGRDTVVFPDAANLDPVSFAPGAITLLLVNVEQEPTPRRTGFNVQQAAPPNSLNLSVLFVTGFEDYRDSLNKLSDLISYLRSNPVFDGPSLPDGVSQLALDAAPLSISGQSELWGALRVSCRPSVLYRARVVSS